MVHIKTTGAAAVAVMAFTQMCPAPIPVIVLAAGAWATAGQAAGAGAALAATGAASGGISKAFDSKRDLTNVNSAKFKLSRRADYPPGVNQQDYDRCINEINDQEGTVHFSDSENGILVENLPPTCMNLANGLTGGDGGSYPVPMSTSSIEYYNISDEERNSLADAIAGNING